MPARTGAGRPAVPTSLKLLRGNKGKRPLSTREPKPKPGLPKAPKWLDSVALEFYQRVGALLRRMQVITEADGEALALAAEAFSEYRAARRACKKGRTYKVTTESGATMIRPRPEVAMGADAWRRVQGALIQFGLTPSSRSKVTVAGDGHEKDPLDEFFGDS